MKPLRLLALCVLLLPGWAQAAPKAKTKAPAVPVLFVPGLAASIPKSGTLLPFVFRRGAPPDSLALSVSYELLVRSLKNAGYVEGRTFFGAVFDWRMACAPTDVVDDGRLPLVTATSITKGDFSYAVNYLGYWLDQAVQANPGLTYVDVVTHSTGGLVARAYIQSAAYGAEYTDRRGVKRRLPKIRHLILGACPNEGTVHTWRPWGGDFQDVLDGFIPTTEIEARFTALAFAYVSGGGTIPGPDYPITRTSILATDKNGNLVPDATTFFRLYTPMRQTLMPTFEFLQRPMETTVVDVNDEPALRSKVMLDLNALSTPGHNPWVSLIGIPGGEGGVISTYATGAREKTSAKDFLIPGLVNKNAFISTLNGIKQLGEDDGVYLPLLALLTELNPATIPVASAIFPRIGDEEITEPLAGDGNGPFISYLSTFANDPKVNTVQWGNGAPLLGLPDGVRWTRQTDYPVYHVVFFYNPDVRAFVVRTLTGRDPAVEPVMTTAEFTRLQKFLSGAESRFTAGDIGQLSKYLDRNLVERLRQLLNP